MAGCAQAAKKKYHEFDVRNFDALSPDQKQCMRWAEPKKEILALNFVGQKRSILKFVVNDCFKKLDNVKYEKLTTSYSSGFSSTKFKEGWPEKYQLELLMKDLARDGDDFPQSQELALQVATEAAKLGSLSGKLYLASSLQTAEPEKAADLFLSAARSGNCVAQAHLALSYFEGIFTERNLAKSYFWLVQANQKRSLTKPGSEPWIPPTLANYYRNQDFEARTLGHALQKNLRYNTKVFCSVLAIPVQFTDFYLGSSNKAAVQSVKNLAVFWQEGEPEPDGLASIIFDEKLKKQKRKVSVEEKPNSQKLYGYQKPRVEKKSLSIQLNPREIYARRNSSVYYLTAARSELASSRNKTSTGTAIAISPNLLITNCHILEDRPIIKIMLPDGSDDRVKLVSGDFDKDVCLIRYTGVLTGFIKNVKPSKLIEIGEEVYAIGNPAGLSKSISSGIVSGLRNMDGVTTIQTNTEISGGSSGGGLFDSAGNLIGITSFGLKGAEGLNFAIAIEEFVLLD